MPTGPCPVPTALTLLCRASMSNPPTLPLPSSLCPPNKGRAPGLLPWLPHACSLPLLWEIARIKRKCLRIPRILPLKKKKKTLTAQKNLFPQSRIEPVPPDCQGSPISVSPSLYFSYPLAFFSHEIRLLFFTSKFKSFVLFHCERSNSWSL